MAKESNWSSSLDRNLSSLINNSDQSDCVFRCGTETFYVHRPILAARSTHFAELFNRSPLKEIILPPHISSQGVKCILRYLYSDECKIPNDSKPLSDALELSKMFRLSELAEFYQSYQNQKKEAYVSSSRLVFQSASLAEEMGKLLIKEEIGEKLSKSDEKRKKFSDVTFVHNGRKIFAHRCILSSRSWYFQNLFSSKWKDSQQAEIPIFSDIVHSPRHEEEENEEESEEEEETESEEESEESSDDDDSMSPRNKKRKSPTRRSMDPFDHFWTLCQFLYTDQLEIDSIEHALDLISLCRYYFLDSLEEKCVNTICKFVTPKNICLIWNANENDIHCDTLSDFCYRFFVAHFTYVVETEGFLSLEKGLLKCALNPGVIDDSLGFIMKHLARWAEANASMTESAQDLLSQFTPPKTLFNLETKNALLYGLSFKEVLLH